jgi:hypothetical protein
MLRYLVLFLVLAAPAYALPVSYDFVATDNEFGRSFPGRFSYDTDTGVGTLTSFVLPYADVPFDVATQTEFWPADRGMFPITYLEYQFDPRGPDFVGASIDITYTHVLIVDSPYHHGCAEGTPYPDCPASSFPYREQSFPTFSLAQIYATPEPQLGALAAAVALAVLSTRRLFQQID